MSQHEVYRDGAVHVRAELCSTCIFRPGNLMHLRSGRVREMVDWCGEHEGVIPCHQTLESDEQSVCRGWYDRFGVNNWMLRLARHLDALVEDE